MNTEINWHIRFTQQASWTSPLRNYLYQKADLENASLILEVGCGTGAILSELPMLTNACIHGVDLDYTRLQEANTHVPSASFINGNALALPFPARFFEICFCHFLLLWVGDPVQVLREMGRVTRTGGNILVMAEPDYSQRMDTPQEMARLGELQNKSLRIQGADPIIGSRLTSLFSQAGINLMEKGTLQRSAPEALKAEDWELEWRVLESDLAVLLPESEIASLKQIDLESRLKGQRTLYIPTHYAWGQI
ncbi:MAG: class I SAM-dependent methyltransferase [Chloroflexota bacterium]